MTGLNQSLMPLSRNVSRGVMNALFFLARAEAERKRGSAGAPPFDVDPIADY